MKTNDILGRGVYSVSEVAAYTGLKWSTVNRWAFGYREYPGIVDPDLPQIEGAKAVSFLALMELYLMRRFQECGLPADKLRIAAGSVARRLGIDHPFAFERLGDYLKHDNRDFFFRDLLGSDWEQLTGRNPGNFVWDEIVNPYLHEVEFEGDYARRWFPAESDRLVVLDPAIKFGEPVLTGTRIPTANVADMVDAGDSVSTVAESYDLTVKQVQAALGFERRLHKAA